MVTSFVQIVGVLLVLNYLIVPAVCAILIAKGFRLRLVVGVLISFVGGVTGLMISFHKDLPSGAAIGCVFGVLLVLAGFVARFTAKSNDSVDL